ncbi:MAG: Fic family protein [Halioglobus sp.]|nr:Fic family protein [Halioglobus sp.]
MEEAHEITDRGESIFTVEPLIVSEDSPHRAGLNDKALDLARKSAALRAAIPAPMRDSLADMVRSMNCYYSNLIEGHHTHPIDIERALVEDFSANPEQRDLQLEARAHIRVQEWIDRGGCDAHPMAPESIKEIHLRFCADLPKTLLVVHDAKVGDIRIEPGALRSRDVQVGRHVAPSPGAVPRLLDHMHRAYARQGSLGAIVGAACAHHRLAWVHPFLDLNGRVCRMVSHALMLNHADSAGLWSVSRGLARREAEYKAQLMAADAPRQGDRDGRGNLSESRLADFAGLFLDTAIDQVDFMTRLMDPDDLRDRILGWANREARAGRLPTRADVVLREALYRGEVERAALPALLGVKERMARNVSAALIDAGALTSNGPRAPLRLAFPARLAGSWMPGLFPEK